MEAECRTATAPGHALTHPLLFSVVEGFLRFWMSAGKGGFGLGSSECIRPAFYCIATKPPVQRLYGPEDEEMGIPTWRVSPHNFHRNPI